MTQAKQADANATAAELYALAQDSIRGQRYPEAEGFLTRSLEKEETANAWHDLGVIFYMRGEMEDAVSALISATELDPGYHQAYANLAKIFYETGDAMQAIECYARAVQAKPDELGYREGFVSLVKYLRVVQPNPMLKEIVRDCLMISALDVGDLGMVWQGLLLSDPSFVALYKTAWDKDFAAFEKAFRRSGDRGALLAPFFLQGLRRVVVADAAFEHFLTQLRRLLLESARDEKLFSSAECETLAAALACYCFATEYIFDVTPAEEKTVSALREAAEAGRAAAPELALLACYFPLHLLANGREITARQAAGPLAEFMRNCSEPFFAQQEIRAGIAALTAVSDTVSVRVREQYEEFPYPQWSGYSKTFKDEGAESYLTGMPAAILVAGCGTGKEAIELAAVFPQAQILAVDLSTASLAYGSYKARQAGIGNITFRHGDILALGDLPQRFDFIACSGVLHHMDDPARGWQVLRDLLRPGGTMRIALYSRLGRGAVIRAREIIARKNYAPDSAGIRAFRRDAERLLKKDDLTYLKGFRDYFLKSECRDLLFHVQEHQFDLPQIAALLDRLGLAFMKFYLPLPVVAQYALEFPQDTAGTDLASWAKFEDRHPDTFKEMYRFWCRKAV